MQIRYYFPSGSSYFGAYTIDFGDDSVSVYTAKCGSLDYSIFTSDDYADRANHAVPLVSENMQEPSVFDCGGFYGCLSDEFDFNFIVDGAAVSLPTRIAGFENHSPVLHVDMSTLGDSVKDANVKFGANNVTVGASWYSYESYSANVSESDVGKPFYVSHYCASGTVGYSGTSARGSGGSFGMTFGVGTVTASRGNGVGGIVGEKVAPWLPDEQTADSMDFIGWVYDGTLYEPGSTELEALTFKEGTMGFKGAWGSRAVLSSGGAQVDNFLTSYAGETVNEVVCDGITVYKRSDRISPTY